MLKFNNEHVITGYIKQLLADFNLPTYRVYTKEDRQYLKEHGEEAPWIIRTIPKTNDLIYPGETINSTDANANAADLAAEQTTYINYIKGNTIQRLVYNTETGAESWNTVHGLHYHYNKKELNQTQNLRIKNNYYDSETHKYLGEFLRFQRDYNNIDLMSMYNCFSNELCPQLAVKQTLDSGKVIEFDTDDDNYKIYMLPVKLFMDYTIAIDCSSKIEIFCAFYDKYYDNRNKLGDIIPLTYKKINYTKFGKPFLYTKLSALYDFSDIASTDKKALEERYEMLREFAQNEYNLKMFIRVPFSNASSITVLEGDYTLCSNGILSNAQIDSTGQIVYSGRMKATVAHTVVNEETGYMNAPGAGEIGWNDKPAQGIYAGLDNDDGYFKPVAPCQLLMGNSGISYPFADRLVEYLLMNVVTHVDENSDNIIRAQRVVAENTGTTFDTEGLWDDKLRILLYEYMMSKHAKAGKLSSASVIDCLGYVDKDVEKNYTSWERTLKQKADGSYVPKIAYTYTNDAGEEVKVQAYCLDKKGNKVLLYEAKPTSLHTIENINLYEDMYPSDEN